MRKRHSFDRSVTVPTRVEPSRELETSGARRWGSRSRGGRRHRGSHGVLVVMALEPRRLLTVGSASDGVLQGLIHDGLVCGLPAVESSPIGDAGLGQPQSSADPIAPLVGADPLTSVPILHSLSGASDFLYLDFDGDFQARWGSYSNISTPAFDQDGDPTTFSGGELTSIQNIWKQVAEDYAPFRIDVTTEQPSSLALGTTMKIVIGGNGSWTGGTYGGIAYINGFTSGPNVGYVFPKNLANGTAKYTGDASAHEAGHGFGLLHQSQYGSGGNKIQDYSPGPGDGTAPLMGNSYSARRSLWWYGTTTSASTYQNDMDVIARSTNGFGYRTDEAGDTASTAAPLTVSGTSVSASGIITTMSDKDYYSFTTDPGSVSFTVTVPTSVSNLAPRLELRSADGSTLIASAGPSGSTFSASLTVSLSTGGSYRLVVQSNGISSGATSTNYGFNVGQYAVNGTIVTSTSTSINAPTDLTATSVNTSRIDLSWADNADNETGYQVQRSSNGSTWSTIADALPADSTTYSDVSAAAGSTYYYRVRAFNDSTNSDYSNQATATTVPVAPSNLVGNATSSTRVNLTWGNVSGETGYRVERSLNGSTWSQIGTTGLNVTTYADTTVSPGATYQYRVKAVNGGGTSASSNVVSVTTPSAPQVPAAPSDLTAVAFSRTRVDLAWTDNSTNETRFKIERSYNNGRTWSQIASVAANVTSYSDTRVGPRRTYSYRVRAYNTSGNSAYSNVATVTTPSNSEPFSAAGSMSLATGAGWSLASPELLALDHALSAWESGVGGAIAAHASAFAKTLKRT